MRALWSLLAFPLAACGDHGSNNPDGGPGAGVNLDVVIRPATTPRPGDTLTFFAVFPDSTNRRYQISWNLDTRGTELLGGCTRGVCAKWIVPAGRGAEYSHYYSVSSPRGISSRASLTLVP